MYLPPDQRQPRRLPPEPPRRDLGPRERTVVLWLVALVLLSIVLAPIGGSTLVELAGYLLRGAR